MLPVGQAPPAGYVPYTYGPTDAGGHTKPSDYSAHAVSPPPQEPSPAHAAGNDWRNSSYQPPISTHQDTQNYDAYGGQHQAERIER